MQAHEIDRVKYDDRSYMCECAECGNQFEATRSDASFCSAKCRVAFSRRPAKRAAAIAGIEAFCHVVYEVSTKYSKNEGVFQAMLKLQRAVNNAVARFEKD